MRTFVTKCVVGDIVTEGEGNGKKVSKKKAAELMLDQLRQVGAMVLPPVASAGLLVQQARKEKEPVYSLVAERGMPRRREFVMQVTVGQQSATGSGPNKKLAKRAAAEALLQLLGYSRPGPQPSKPALRSPGEGGGEKGRKLTFVDEVNNGSVSNRGRQLVPGLLYIDEKAPKS